MTTPLAFGFGSPLEITLAPLLVLLLWGVSLADLARRRFPDGAAKPLWALVILLVPCLGAVLYLLIGRGQGSVR